jgi:hypothetical protein
MRCGCDCGVSGCGRESVRRCRFFQQREVWMSGQVALLQCSYSSSATARDPGHPNPIHRSSTATRERRGTRMTRSGKKKGKKNLASARGGTPVSLRSSAADERNRIDRLRDSRDPRGSSSTPNANEDFLVYFFIYIRHSCFQSGAVPSMWLSGHRP